MTRVILDTGALIAYERRDPEVTALLEGTASGRQAMRTTTAAVAQAWRSGSRQARLAMLLHGVDEVVMDSAAARRIGELLRRNGTADVVDASIVDAAAPGDEILTSDPDDIRALADSVDLRVIVTPIH